MTNFKNNIGNHNLRHSEGKLKKEKQNSHVPSSHSSCYDTFRSKKAHIDNFMYQMCGEQYDSKHESDIKSSSQDQDKQGKVYFI